MPNLKNNICKGTETLIVKEEWSVLSGTEVCLRPVLVVARVLFNSLRLTTRMDGTGVGISIGSLLIRWKYPVGLLGMISQMVSTSYATIAILRVGTMGNVLTKV